MEGGGGRWGEGVEDGGRRWEKREGKENGIREEGGRGRNRNVGNA